MLLSVWELIVPFIVALVGAVYLGWPIIKRCNPPTLMMIMVTIAEMNTTCNQYIFGMTPMTEINNLGWCALQYALALLIPTVFSCTFFCTTFSKFTYLVLVLLAFVQYYLANWNPYILQTKLLEQQTAMFVNLWFEYFTTALCLAMVTVDTFHNFITTEYISCHVAFHSEVIAEVCFWAAYITVALVEKCLIDHAVNNASNAPYVVVARLGLRLLCGMMTYTKCAIVPSIQSLHEESQNVLVPVSNQALLDKLRGHMQAHNGKCTMQNCPTELKQELVKVGIVGMPHSEPKVYKTVIHFNMRALREKIISGTFGFNAIVCTGAMGIPAVGFTAVAVRIVGPGAYEYIRGRQDVFTKTILYTVWSFVFFIAFMLIMAEAKIVSDHRMTMKMTFETPPAVERTTASIVQETGIGLVFTVFNLPFLFLLD